MAKQRKPKPSLTARQLASKALEKKYRAKVAKLKAKGVFTSKVDARKQTTRYQRSKVRQFGDVLEGIVKPIRVTPKIRKEYEARGQYQTRGPFVLFPGDVKTSKTKEGYVKEHRKDYTILKLPFEITSMQQVVKQLKKDPTLNGLRKSDETFVFRINKHPARMDRMANYYEARGQEEMIGFSTVAQLAEYIEVTYRHLFKKNEGNEAIVTSFELVAFHKGRVPTGQGAVYDNRKRNGWTMSADGSRMIPRKKKATAASRERDRLKKAAKRANETEAQRAERLARDKSRKR